MTKPVDEWTVKAVVEALHEGKTLRAACEGAGVSAGALLMRVERSARLKGWMAEAARTMAALVEDALYEAALDGNVTAQTLYLCNRAPERWRPAASAKASAEPAGGGMTPADLLLKYRREDGNHETACAQDGAERGDGQGASEPEVA
ncbi:MAG TPA: hypothetical protein P5137_10575 [Candidatus Brocadiia bacterium]|nr:hypothetical protein [Candidatus Brocadiia bacterium]